jgi:urea transport system ATP-binding protein
LLGWDIRTDHAKFVLYFVCSALLLASMLLARGVIKSKLGRILVAVRDKEDRVRFSGYDVANFKIFIFCLASGIAAVGGAMFTLQVGFMSPSFVEGSIKFKDREITGLKEHQIVRRGIGRKFQTPSIYEDLTVFENLEISLPRGRDVAGALFWKRTPEVIEKVREVAEMIFLEEQLDRLAETLSHGQKQWLEIGMLLMQEPELLMLDEPVAGMSVSERARTAELLELVSKGRSVIVIEHDMKFVESIADRVTVLHQGKVLAEGSMATIQDNAQVKEVYLGH